MRPLIGISCSELRRRGSVRQVPEGEPPQEELGLGLTYVKAVERAGAIPVVLPPMARSVVADLLEGLAGLCLSGGPDLDPACYRRRPHPSLGPTEPEVDDFELALVRGAEARELPLLAICRGAQVLNVARGGTLHQHLPDLEPEDDERVEHRQSESADVVTHTVQVDTGTRLHELVGNEEVEVNSFHHQAVERLGRDLAVTAHSPDDVIEGIEIPGHPFAVGVQWHAECLVDREDQLRLFEGLTDAAARFAGTGRRGLRAA
jgi:putative glutamine amidotransferase